MKPYFSVVSGTVDLLGSFHPCLAWPGRATTLAGGGKIRVGAWGRRGDSAVASNCDPFTLVAELPSAPGAFGFSVCFRICCSLQESG